MFSTHLQATEEGEVKAHLWPALREALDLGGGGGSLTLEKAWLLAAVHRRFPGVPGEELPSGLFGRDGGELCRLAARWLADSSAPLHVMRRHPGLPALVRALRRAGRGLLREFWVGHVDPTALAAEASRYRMVLGFTVLKLVVEAAEKEEEGDDEGDDEEVEVCDFLTANVVRSALSCLSKVESSPEEDKLILDVLGKFTAR